MRLATGCLCLLACLLSLSCSSGPDGRKPVASFAEEGKPPTSIMGVAFGKSIDEARTQVLSAVKSEAVSNDSPRELRVKGRFWGCPGDAVFTFSGGGLTCDNVTIIVDTAPGKLLEILASELKPGEPYLFRRTETAATWHWSYSSQPLFDIELAAADDQARSSRVAFTRIRAEAESSTLRSTTRTHGSYHNQSLEDAGKLIEENEPRGRDEE
jgi:hypothetical protein